MTDRTPQRPQRPPREDAGVMLGYLRDLEAYADAAEQRERAALSRAEAAELERNNLHAFMTALAALESCGCQFCQAVERADELLPALAQATADAAALRQALDPLELAVNASVSGIRKIDIPEWSRLLAAAQAALATDAGAALLAEVAALRILTQSYLAEMETTEHTEPQIAAYWRLMTALGTTTERTDG